MDFTRVSGFAFMGHHAIVFALQFVPLAQDVFFVPIFSASLMALNSSVPYQLMLMGALFIFFFCLYCDGWINLARRGKKYNQGRADSTICALPCLDLSFQPFVISVCRCPEPLNQVERR
jgi:hypothetical protein